MADHMVAGALYGTVMECTNVLRSIERDGKHILQQAWQGPDYENQRFHVEWRDVPVGPNPTQGRASG